MMPSKMTDLLPLALTQWFTGRRRSDTNGTVPAADTPEPTPEREPDRIQSPPAKRARYEPSASVTNYYAQPEIAPVHRPEEPVAGPSGFRPERAASPLAAREARVERWADAGPARVARTSLFQRGEAKAEDGSGKKGTPTTPNALKRPSAGSPFYAGRTMYGGAGASSMYLYEPNIRQRATAVVAPPLCDADNAVSSTTRRLMGLLERCAAPLARAQPPAGNLAGGNESVIGRTIAPSFSSSYKTQELHVSHLPTLLRLKQGARLREGTRAARRAASAAPYALGASAQPGSGEMTTSTPWPKQSNKMKSQVGRNPARKGVQSSIETDILPPLNLPTGILNIDTNNLPKISFSGSSDVQAPKNASVEEKHRENVSEFKFSKPTGVIEQPSMIPTNNSKFTFSKPEDISQGKKITNGPKKLAEIKTNDFKFGITNKENGETPVKNWSCKDCRIVNKDETLKCMLCGTSKPIAVMKPSESIVKDWQCKDCWVFNKDAVQNCIACGGSKPIAVTKPSESVVKDWQCKDCWVFNKDAVQNCIACGGSKPVAVTKPTESVVKDWQCKDCWVFNKDAVQNCIACGGSKPIAVTKPSESVVKDWQCKDCWVFNKDAVQNCIACGGSKPIAVTKPSESIVKDWQCKDCWVFNKDAVQNCIACGGSKPSAPEKSTESIQKPAVVNNWKCKTCWVVNKADVQKCIACGDTNTETAKASTVQEKSIAKDWKCQDCWVMNKEEEVKCIACGGSRPVKSANAKSDWQCKECWVFNKDETSKCVVCGGSKPTSQTPVSAKVGDWSNTKIAKVSGWTCNDCWVSNENSASECVACGGPNPKKNTSQSPSSQAQNSIGNTSRDNSFSTLVTKQKEQWECPTCLARNSNSVGKCICCEAAKPGAKINEESAKFNFPATPTSFKFGIPSTNASDKEKKDKASDEDKSAKGILNVDSSKSTPSKTVTFTFGMPKAAAEGEAKSNEKAEAKDVPKFSFGLPTKSEGQGGFKLPESPLNTDKKSVESVGKSEVDALKLPVSQSSKGSLSSSVNVTSVSTPISFNFTSESGQLFKPVSEKAASDSAAPISTASLFSFSSNTAKTSEAPSTLFAMPTSTAKTTASSTPLFGSLTNMAKTTEVSSSLFSMPSNAGKTTDVTTSLFGTTSVLAKPTDASGALFGTAKTAEGSLFNMPTSTAKTEPSSALFTIPSNVPKTSETPSLFGVPSNLAKTTEPGPALFGTQTNITKTTESGTLFGMPSNAAKAETPTLFGVTSSAGKPVETSSLFGVMSNTSKTTEASGLAAATKSPLFPSSGAFTLPKSDAPSSQAQAPLFSFGSSAQDTPKTAPTPSRFNFSFGGTPSESALPAFNTSFGAPTTQQASNPTPAVPAFTLPNNNLFGAQPQASLFGANAQNEANKPANVPNKAPFSFGSPSNTLFGNPQPQTNTTANTSLFGSPQTQGATLFGTSQAPNNPTPTLFAGQAASNPAPMFGASGMGGATFGAVPSTNPPGGLGQAAAPLGQAPAFNFGATSAAPMFGFGQQQSAPPQPGVYSFGTGPAPGVQFSLGTSAGTPQAAAPGARRVRKAVRRTQR